MPKASKMFLLPLVILVIIVVFVFGFEPAFLQGSIAQVLGSEISQESTDQYLLASGDNAASVILYNQFSDRDFDGLLDQDDPEINKFAIIKFSPNEQVQFAGSDIVFNGIEEKNGELIGQFTINDEYNLPIEVDTTTYAKRLSLVGREFYKQGRNEYAIIFIRAN